MPASIQLTPATALTNRARSRSESRTIRSAAAVSGGPAVGVACHPLGRGRIGQSVHLLRALDAPFLRRVQEDRQHARAPAQRLRGAAADDHRGLRRNLALDYLLDDLLLDIEQLAFIGRLDRRRIAALGDAERERLAQPGPPRSRGLDALLGIVRAEVFGGVPQHLAVDVAQ